MSEKREVLANAVYSAAEVAALVGLSRVKSVHEIPEDELVPTYVGARGGRKVYRGSDVIHYLDAKRRAPRVSLRKVG